MAQSNVDEEPVAEKRRGKTGFCRDVAPNETATYECHRCGAVVTASAHPGDCPDCEVGFRNRSTPLE